jgi:hypothetical protein
MTEQALKTRQIEFGDYQTPTELAEICCDALRRIGVEPCSILEPTCGLGNFLAAAVDRFPAAQKALGLEINTEYSETARKRLEKHVFSGELAVRNADFFSLDWNSVLAKLPDPILVIGNPPWVTNSALGQIGSDNLPVKTNFQNHSGLDAITGKSNFDISEWMLLRLFEWLSGRAAVIAMLCKTSVARKVLRHAWKSNMPIREAELFPINANQHFGAAVEACFMVAQFAPSSSNRDCVVYDSSWRKQCSTFGFRDGDLVADVFAYESTNMLNGPTSYKWRSGIKHDCSKVMELQKTGQSYANALGQTTHLEDTYLYPMLKSSDLKGGILETSNKWMIVPQRTVGEDTSSIARTAPKTWDYLNGHRPLLDRRASVIYHRRPPFSVFGVGDYSFAPWKVAISGFYKRMRFTVVGSLEGKPMMLDDTAYFLPCSSQAEAVGICEMLASDLAQEFFDARVFWDAKRPITVSLLSQLSVERLASALGRGSDLTTNPFSGQLLFGT